jgi:uncharacterized membrane protein
MADFPPTASNTSSLAAADLPITAAVITYALFAVAAVSALVSSGLVVFAPLVGLAGIVGVIIAYIKRGDARGSWLESHFTWLIRTFWWSLLWGLLAGLVLITLGLVLIGIPIAIAMFAITSIWGIYRVVRGYLAFKDSKRVP